MLEERDKDQLAQLLMAAESLKPKLLSMFALGPRSLESEAYAVKARVKSYESAQAKILKKRSDGATYGPNQLTDVIGLRVLCLWPDDIAKVFERLVQVLREVVGTTLSSFASHDLSEVITEVIIYKAPSSPAIYEVIKDHIVQLFAFNPKLGACVRTEPSPPDRPYSSVHMVLWCRTQVLDSWISIPVELQVRTSLEDVWSEVDHRLKYKGKPSDDTRAASAAHQILNSLKTQLDSAATLVLAARDLLAEPRPIASASVARFVERADPLEVWGLRDSKPDIQQAALAMDKRLSEFYAEFERHPSPSPTVWAGRFAELEQEIRALSDRIERQGAEHSDWWKFTSRMELAQVIFWRARLAKGENQQSGQERFEDIERLTDECLHLYLDIVDEGQFDKSAMLWFRLGNALLELRGEFWQASGYLRRAYEMLEGDATVPPDSPFRSVIPRLYAYCVWRTHEEEFEAATIQYGPKSALAGYSLDPLTEAIGLMLPLVTQVDGLAAQSGFWNKDLEKIKVLNNLISYVWYFAVRSVSSTGAAPTRGALAEAAQAIATTGALQASYKGLASLVTTEDTYKSDLDLLHSLAVGALMAGDDQRLSGFVKDLRNRLEAMRVEEGAESAILKASKLEFDLGILGNQLR